MKNTLFTIVVILLAIFNSFAQSSTVTFFTQDGEKIWVVVNGEKKNKEPLTKVVIENLTAQNYKFKVLFQDDKIPSLDKTVYTRDVDNKYHNSTYTIRKDTKGSKYVIRLNSDEVVTTTTTTTTTPANTNTTTTTTINSQPQNQTNTQTYNQTTTTTSGNPQNMNMGVGVNVNETENGVDMNINMGGVNVNTSASGNDNGMNSSTNMNIGGANTTNSTITSSTTTTTTTTTSSNSNLNNNQNNQVNPKPIKQQQTYVMQGYSGPVGCPWPMAEGSFATAKQSISSKSFEDSKLTIAKQIAGSNCLLCSQVKEIMMLFSFEDSRLEFAKLAYKHTFDIGNYFQLNDAFKFESSIDDLNQFINSGN